MATEEEVNNAQKLVELEQQAENSAAKKIELAKELENLTSKPSWRAKDSKRGPGCFDLQ